MMLSVLTLLNPKMTVYKSNLVILNMGLKIYVIMNDTMRPSCSKLTTLLANEMLYFQIILLKILQFLAEKL